MIYISIIITTDEISDWPQFEENLNSLLNQKIDKEYYVILSIPETCEIPIKILEFIPKLIINRNVSNYGEIGKLISVLGYSTNPDDIIVVCNCNNIYHEEMLEYHIKKLNEYPNHAICFGGENGIDKKLWVHNNEIRYVFRNTSILLPTDRDRYILIPSHAYSVGYLRKYFKDDFNENIWNLTNHDDLLMAYYLKKHEIWPLCVTWDKETDFRPRNDGFFPITKKTLNISKEYTINKENMNEIIKTLLYYDMETPEGKGKVFYIKK